MPRGGEASTGVGQVKHGRCGESGQGAARSGCGGAGEGGGEEGGGTCAGALERTEEDAAAQAWAEERTEAAQEDDGGDEIWQPSGVGMQSARNG